MIIAVIMMSISCSEDDEFFDENIKIDTTVIFPLTPGIKWSYIENYDNFEGDFASYEVPYYIKDSLNIGGETLYKYGWYALTNIGTYYSNREDGLYIFDTTESSLKLMFKFPCEVGDITLMNEDTIKVIKKNHITDNFGKIYSTIHYQRNQSTDKEIINENWYMAPGIGIVNYSFVKLNLLDKSLSTKNQILFEMKKIR